MDRDPDISLQGLSIWIDGRERPDDVDYWDANWLRVRAQMEAEGARVWWSGPWLTVPEIAHFRDQLVSMHRTVSGTAKLDCLEPYLGIELYCGPTGHVQGKIDITPDQIEQRHQFEIGLDQSYLPRLIAACDEVLERWTIIGSP